MNNTNFKLGDKVQRVHPTYAHSKIELDVVYTVSAFDDIRISLLEVGEDYLFLAEAFKLVVNK